ncbi:MAG: phosphate signaling complex protein PhoU [Lachnospiraceae bacterium]
MRDRYEAQLRESNRALVELGELCEKAITLAIEAFLSSKKELIEQVKQIEIEIDESEKRIERDCLNLLLMQHPIATDLRVVSAALKMITDLERIGDQAADIAYLTKYTDGTTDDSNIKEMTTAVIKMVKNAVDSYVNRDLQLAKEVIEYDDVIDDLFLAVKADTVKAMQVGVAGTRGEGVLDVFMIAKYLERIGDHATNVAEWVEFSITGHHKDNN